MLPDSFNTIPFRQLVINVILKFNSLLPIYFILLLQLFHALFNLLLSFLLLFILLDWVVGLLFVIIIISFVVIVVDVSIGDCYYCLSVIIIFVTILIITIAVWFDNMFCKLCYQISPFVIRERCYMTSSKNIIFGPSNHDRHHRVVCWVSM